MTTLLLILIAAYPNHPCRMDESSVEKRQWNATFFYYSISGPNQCAPCCPRTLWDKNADGRVDMRDFAEVQRLIQVPPVDMTDEPTVILPCS